MKSPSTHSRGSALLVVLAFLLLLTTLVVAFLSRATFERQLSNASFSLGKVDLAGQGAINAIIGDLQQEMVAGSNGGTLTLTGGYLYPNSAATAVPAIVGFTPAAGVENLLKISYPAPFWPSTGYSAAGPQRASSVSSGTASLNYRLVTNARWNKPLLMNPINVATTAADFTPPSAFTSNPPDWIYVARDGSNPTSWNSSYEYLASVAPTTTTSATAGTNPITQRYAYAIYDEGSTLDLNVAGSPFINTTAPYYSTNQPYKNALPYADLTQLPYNGPGGSTISTLSATQQQVFVNAIVGWRNFASSFLGSGSIFPNSYSLSSTLASASFDQNVIFNPGGFMTVSGPATTAFLITGTTPTTVNDGPQTGVKMTGTRNQTDNAFVSRQRLLQFFLLGLGQNSTFTSSTGSNLSLANLEQLLPYFGTFSRDINQPSYAPDPNRPVVQSTTNGGNDMAGLLNSTFGTNSTYSYPATTAVQTAQNTINPSFLSVTASTTFTRNDGSSAVIGEPLVKKRFALMRLAWLTYKGPVADRTYFTSTANIAAATSPGPTSADYDVWALVNVYGIPQSFLAQGTDANIAKYFGLVWGQDTGAASATTPPTFVGIGDQTYKWKYEHGTNQTTPGVFGTGSPGRIMTLTAPSTTSASVQATGRDPDFFELLKAAVNVGAIAKPGTLPGRFITTGTTTATMATPAGYSNEKDSSVDAYIMQLGANIIAQSNPSNYCPRIIFDDGVTFNNGTNYPQEYRGIEDLPYLYGTRSAFLKVVESNPATASGGATWGSPGKPFTGSPVKGCQGDGVILEVPEIWNPHTWNPSATAASGISPVGNGTMASPEFQMLMLDNDPNGYPSGVSGYTSAVGTPNLGTISLTVTSRNDGHNSVGNQGLHGPTNTFTLPNQAISFSIPSSATGLSFFREPTLLNKPDPANTTANYSGTSTAVPAGAGPPAGSWVTSSLSCSLTSPTTTGYIPSYFKSWAYVNASPVVTDNKAYLGFNIGSSTTISNATTPFVTTATGPSATTVSSSTYPLIIPDTSPNYVEVSDLYLTNPYAGSITAPAGVTGNQNYTYRMQYQDPITAGKWDTYDEKFLPLSYPYDGSGFNMMVFGGGTGTNIPWFSGSVMDPIGAADFVKVADPRTNRWDDQADLITNRFSGAAIPPPIYNNGSGTSPTVNWLDASINAVPSGRPDFYPGWPVMAEPSSETATFITLGFYGPISANNFINAGVFSQNTTTNYANNYSLKFATDTTAPGYPVTAQYYADPDGVVRRGTAAYSTAFSSSGIPPTPYGMPMATSTTLSGTSAGTPTPAADGNRPYILHRPFRTVAELGYTFSGTPGKNIDFSTPESGYSALLDVFCINDTNDPNNLVAGKVNINTRQAPVLEAILGAAYKNELSSCTPASADAYPSSTTMLSTEASSLITNASYGLINYRTSNLTTASLGPLRNISELVGKYVSANYTSSLISGTGPAATPPTPYAYNSYNATTPANSLYSGFSADMTGLTTGSPPMNVAQRFHEAAIRALAANTTCRVWNLMIDVIAQTGRFPSSTTSLANFNVEGERRYWVHVAIDRYTGKVLDEQVEEVKE